MAAILFSSLAACTNSGITIDSARQKAIVDSIVTSRSEVLTDSVNQVCNDRLTNEVSAKVDSIMTAMKEQAETEEEKK